MAPTGADVRIVEILSHRGDAAPHLLAWMVVGGFLLLLAAIWDERRPARLTPVRCRRPTGAADGPD